MSYPPLVKSQPHESHGAQPFSNTTTVGTHLSEAYKSYCSFNGENLQGPSHFRHLLIKSFWGLNERFYNHTLSFFFGPCLPASVLHLIFAQKPFLGFSIIYHLKRLEMRHRLVICELKNSWFLIFCGFFLYLTSAL